MSAAAIAAAVQIAAQAYQAIAAAVEGQDMDPAEFTRQVEARIAESESAQQQQLAKDRALWGAVPAASPAQPTDAALVQARALEQIAAAQARLVAAIPVGELVLPAWLDDGALD